MSNPFNKALSKALGVSETPSGKRPVYPEPGAWVLDTPKGMPKIELPEPLPPGPIDIETVKEHILYEGLGACIYELIPHARITDQYLVGLWLRAKRAMRDIVEYLENHNYQI